MLQQYDKQFKNAGAESIAKDLRSGSQASCEQEGKTKERPRHPGNPNGANCRRQRVQVSCRARRRVKVDLTKYIEEHQFTFDQVFDETVDNGGVSLSLSLKALQGSCPTTGLRCVSGHESYMFCLWTDGEREDFYNDRDSRNSGPFPAGQQRHLLHQRQGNCINDLVEHQHMGFLL